MSSKNDYNIQQEQKSLGNDQQPPSSTNPSLFIPGIHAISSSYDTFLLDMWGVMHNGSKPYDGVLHTVQQLKQAGKKMIILSNSSKRIDDAEKVLVKLGFDIRAFDQIITSGEISYRMLCGDESLQCSKWDVLTNLIRENKRKVFVFGSGDGDEEYVESCGWSLAPVEEADLIIARGTFTIQNQRGSYLVSKKDDEGEYFDILNESLDIAAKRRIPMLVTNPDRVRPDEGLPPMPGAIGDAYEKRLGGGGDGGANDSDLLVKRIGKPYGEVYELALNGCQDRRKAVMVGDALETDVMGGTKFQCDTAWIVNDGIHSPFVKEYGEGDFEKGVTRVLEKFNHERKKSLKPTFVAKHFQW
jgi:HAD superfamily hydrolase (TIGR01450 family)